MAETNRWAIREVAIASIFDAVTNEFKVKLDTLKASGLENTASIVYAMGGPGNPRLVGFSGDKAARFTLQDAIYSNELIAMFMGTEIESGATAVQRNEVLTVSGGSITLSYPLLNSDAILSVDKLLVDGTKGEHVTKQQYTVADRTITFSGTDIFDGDQIQVYYNVTSGTSAKKLTNRTDKFAGTWRIVLDCLVRDLYTKKDFAAQITIPNAKIDDSAWNIAMAPDGDPSVFDIPLEALKPANSKDLYTMVIYDEDDLPN